MTQANCGTNDGTATVNVVSGGSGTFSYLWDVPAGSQTSATAVSVLAGTYTVVVTDDVTGCTKDTTVTVTSTTGITVTANFIQDAQCNGASDGSAYPTIVGGTAPFTFSWNTAPIAQTDSILLAGAGFYTLSVTDGNGCTGSDTITINEPTAVVASIVSSTDETCLGANNGSATVGGAQGTGGYTYLWMPGGQTTANATGLAPGDYTAYVYDDNLCVDSVQVTINPGPMMTSTHTSVDVSCFNGTNGSIDVTVGGAPGAISYAWT
ncbi:hypothetical protein FRY74_12765, partial [Vicingus serpentipes]